MSNPYESPQVTPSQPVQPRPRRIEESSADDERIARYAQLGLRLLGVMFLVDGVAGIAGGLVYGVMQSTIWEQAGYDSFFDQYACGWIAGGVASFVAGLYFTIGGRWVLEMVFLPSRPIQDDDDDPLAA
jgi:hypothetical protein